MAEMYEPEAIGGTTVNSRSTHGSSLCVGIVRFGRAGREVEDNDDDFLLGRKRAVPVEPSGQLGGSSGTGRGGGRCWSEDYHALSVTLAKLCRPPGSGR